MLCLLNKKLQRCFYYQHEEKEGNEKNIIYNMSANKTKGISFNLDVTFLGDENQEVLATNGYKNSLKT